MKITIKFPNRRIAEITGSIVSPKPNEFLYLDLKRLWEAERAINELTNLKIHFTIEEDDDTIKKSN